jgi:acyl-CoA dehydrogenase
MDFTMSPRAKEIAQQVHGFMQDHVYPAEPVYAEQRAALTQQGRTNDVPEVLTDLIGTAKRLGLWNLFLPEMSSLTNVEYAVLAEETGRSPFIAPAAMNCQSPDSGNMEMLHRFGTIEQKKRWLEPLLDGSIRSGFSMTEPDVASSDARNIVTRIERDGDDYVINGRKWFTTGAADPRTSVLIVLGQSDPDGESNRRHTMIIVPKDTPGVSIVRTLPVFGFQEQQGHCEVVYTDVRVPAANVLGGQGNGLAVAQGRLGPGRIHHCMRAVGMAERAVELMCDRAASRHAFGKRLADQGVVQAKIAEARLAIDQARLLVLRCAWRVDQVGVDECRTDISAIKVVAPRMAEKILDDAIQLFGAAGVTGDTPLAEIWSRSRTLRIVDGPEDVHLRAVSRNELRPYLAATKG